MWSNLVLGCIMLAVVLSTRWLRLNVSPSVPYGVYRLTAVPSMLSRGMLVLVPTPTSVQPWHPAQVPLLKPVAALAGDTVCVQDGGLQIAGQWYGPVLDAADGRRLPQWHGCLVLHEGEVFLASAAARSLDGRYFGVVKGAALTARALPLWTWE